MPVKLIEVDRMGRLNLSYIDAIDPDGESFWLYNEYAGANNAWLACCVGDNG